jgi:hypothetical protein
MFRQSLQTPSPGLILHVTKSRKTKPYNKPQCRNPKDPKFVLIVYQ